MNGLRISQLAERAGVTTSTVRYYERIGLVPAPSRTPSGYRAYEPEAEARLLFITRGKRMGLSLDEISELMAIWDGTNCGATKERLVSLIDDKRAEIGRQIDELRSFERQLAEVQTNIAASATPATCDADLGCCAPALGEVEITAHIPLRQIHSEGAHVSEPIPIACTLTVSERPEREAALAALFAQVDSWQRTSRSLQLHFAATPQIEADVAALTAAESACCSFLAFDTQRDAGKVLWEITAPSDEAGVVLDEFAALLPASSGSAVQ